MLRFCFLLLLSSLHLNASMFRHRGCFNRGKLNISDDGSVQTKWLTQNLDHFDPTNTKTWKQRYYVNDQYYKSKNGNGPVFLLMGDEIEATAFWMTNHPWVSYGQKHGALLFQLEHRFYGESHPTEDVSTENLRYLNTEQALADTAVFIDSMNREYNLTANVKWIAFGCSYGGTLAAWLRLKYPHLLHGAVASSGPVKVVLNFFEYLQIVTKSLETYSKTCPVAIQEAINQTHTLMKDPAGQKKLNTIFKLCTPIEKSVNNPRDVSNFIQSFSGEISRIVQNNKGNFNTSAWVNVTIDTLCNTMTNKSIGHAVDRLAAFNSLFLNLSGSSCLDYVYQNWVTSMLNTSWDSDMVSGGGRQYYYQTCTEYGYYQTSTGKPQLFGDAFPLQFFIDQCRDVFGDMYNRTFLDNAIRRTNILFGGLNLKASNIVFIFGSIDPWHAMGITKSTNPGITAIYINGTAHCADYYPESEKDLPGLPEARQKIQQLISSWLNS